MGDVRYVLSPAPSAEVESLLRAIRLGLDRSASYRIASSLLIEYSRKIEVVRD